MPVDVEFDVGGVAVVTLNKPASRNALTVELGRQLSEVVSRLTSDQSVRAVILTGAGSAFSAGGDLDMLERLAADARRGVDVGPTMRAFYQGFLSVRDLPVPVVAAINGHAVGAGLCLALACDLRIIAEEAKAGLNFAQLGLHPGMGGSWLLPRIIGAQAAAEWLYTGRLYSGAEAARRGLALAAMPAAEVLPRAIELARSIAGSPPLAVRQLKLTLSEVENLSLSDALVRESECQAVGFASADTAERLAALRDKADRRVTAAGSGVRANG